ncbi:MAG: Eco29kI family restriction endonuclease [Treponema sp.]|nr:Eco29kI family restriction endonuclease [Treponema sp.]
MTEKIFNPLDKRNLGESIAEAILRQKVYPLGNIPPFKGAGIYVIYYNGDFTLYKKLSEKNKNDFLQPIYAGKAIPEGGRKGGFVADIPAGEYLYKRLNEHKKSVEAAENLDIKDFYCRYLVVDDIWIPLGESLLIENAKPLWNIVIDGFGNHDPGKGRYNQQMSVWDVLHPGRIWAKKLQAGKSIGEIKKLISDFLK